MDVRVTVALIALSGVCLTALFKLGDFFLVQRNKKNKRNRETHQRDLFDHCLFSKVSYWTEKKIFSLYFGCVYRNYIYRKVITIKFTTISNKAHDFLMTNTLKKLSDVEFKSKVFMLISDIISTYNSEIRKDFMEKFKSGEYIYDYVMNDPDKGFNVQQDVVITFVERMIEETCNSDLGLSNVEKFEIVLDILVAALGSTLPYLEKTYRGINGTLEEALHEK